MYHVTTGTNGQWIMIGGDRLSTSGTSYIDFEFLQNTLTRNTSGGKFTGAGPDGGRTLGDLVISMEYTGGGSTANVYFYRWSTKSGGGFEFKAITPAAGTAFAKTNAVNEDVPFGAFGSTVYAPFAFVEGAINITQLLAAGGEACAGLSVKTLWIKTKASSSSTAALKDFMEPLPVSFTFGSASISYATPFCKAPGNASVTRSGTAGGTYTATPAGLSIDENTGTINIGASTAGSYTVTYSFNAGGTCTRTATAPVVINPTPTVLVNSPVKCASDPAVTITATPTPSTGTYSYVWTVPQGASDPGNVASFSATVGGTYSVVATRLGCSGSGSGTLTVNPNPNITSPAIGNVCVGATSASLSYTGVSGNPDKYRIDWNTSAESAGLTDISLTTLTNSPISLTIPGTLAAATYTGTIYVKNTSTTPSCESSGGTVTLTVNAPPTANAGTDPNAQCYLADGNTFNLTTPTGTNGTYLWTVQSNTTNATVAITGATTITPSVKVTFGTSGGTVTLRLTVTSNASPSCGTAFDEVDLTVSEQVQGPSVSILPVTCTDKTFSLQVDNPQNGTKYTLTQPGNTNDPIEITYNGVDPVIFTNLVFGDGGSVVANSGSCSSAPGSCEPAASKQAIGKTQLAQPNKLQVVSSTKVTAAPNPFNDNIRFTITPGATGRGSLELYNLLGQKVKTVFEGQVQKGQVQSIQYTVPSTQRTNLIYFFRVGTDRASGKLINLR
jgi:hypothetical protein